MSFGLDNPPGSILVFGGSGIDYIAQVSSFPDRDSKIRTQDARILVGGNAANTAAALARLGAHCRLLSKIGSDANGKVLLDSLSSSMGVIVDDIIKGDLNEITAFTYVIVCQKSLSRTCIHTPLLSEISVEQVTRFICQTELCNDFEFVHFDSRHTEAAVTLAQHFHSRISQKDNKFNAILSIDVEKSRQHIANLIRYCHIIFTNKTGIIDMFPSFCGTTDDDFLLQAASLFGDETTCADTCNETKPRDCSVSCKLIVMTDGAKGSTLLFRHTHPPDGTAMYTDVSFASLHFQDFMKPYHDKGIDNSSISLRRTYSGPKGGFISSELREYFDAIAKNILAVKYDILESTDGDKCQRFGVIRFYYVKSCSSFVVDTEDIVDSTGAGDAYVGGFLFGLMQNASLQESMILGTVVATEGLYSLGAQTNLPSVDRVLEVVTSKLSET